jgi:hypothetical protein
MVSAQLPKVGDEGFRKCRMRVLVELRVTQVRDLRLVSAQFDYSRARDFSKQQPRATLVHSQQNWEVGYCRDMDIQRVGHQFANRRAGTFFRNSDLLSGRKQQLAPQSRCLIETPKERLNVQSKIGRKRTEFGRPSKSP